MCVCFYWREAACITSVNLCVFVCFTVCVCVFVLGRIVCVNVKLVFVFSLFTFYSSNSDI